MTPHSPIVVLDSGLGGLTVVRALRAALPGEDILYFGDTARLPYGSKTGATVTRFVEEIIRYFRPYDPKHVLIACNTATALALPAVRGSFPDLPITGVIEPGARAAVAAAGAKAMPLIGIIATEATVRSRAYERAIHRRRHHVRLLQKPTPLLVPIIEEGRGGKDPLVRLALQQYLEPLLRHKIDVLVLGCTHYPILKPAIAQIVGAGVAVIDSAEQCAQDVAGRLRARGLARDRGEGSGEGSGDEASPDPGSPAARPGHIQTFVTDDPPRFKRLASRFLGIDVDLPTWVAPDALYQGDRRDEAPVAMSIPA